MNKESIYEAYEKSKEIDELIYKKRLEWAILASIIIHILILYIVFPNFGKIIPQQKKKRKIVVVRRFYRPPEKTRKKTIKKKKQVKKKRIFRPIPDPTPNEPEIEPEETFELEPEPEEIIPEDAEIVFGEPEGPPAPDAQGPIRVTGNVVPPVCIKRVKPKYPEIARKARIEGIVIIEAIINKQGKVVSARVIKGLGKALNEAALEAVYQWEFTPATLNGVPVDVYFNLTVVFKLK